MRDLPGDKAGAAPFHAEIAGGPADVQCHWLTCADGVRIRVAHWGAEGARGTILLFPGRTEYVEKYAPAAAEFIARGYGVCAVDWRGQGLADRLIRRPMLGHVGQFGDYQHDVAAVLAHVQAAGLPQPFHLIGHSMGGAIGLRALMNGLPVRSAVFTGPMWGIRIAPLMRPVAWGLSTISRPLGLDGRLTPGQTADNYVRIAPFVGNTLTSDRAMFDFMRRQLTTHPELALGGPTLGWLHESLKETRDLVQSPAPDLPCLTYLGADEEIVDTPAVRRRIATWPGARLVDVPGGRHEVMMEAPAIRNAVFDGATAFFDSYG